MSARGRWVSSPTMRSFSLRVRFSSTAAYWPARPIEFRTAPASVVTSWPRTRAPAAAGWRMVVRIRTAVVLPAPLGPRRPNTVPGGTERSIPSRAETSPNRLTRPRATMAAVSMRPVSAKSWANLNRFCCSIWGHFERFVRYGPPSSADCSACRQLNDDHRVLRPVVVVDVRVGLGIVDPAVTVDEVPVAVGLALLEREGGAEAPVLALRHRRGVGRPGVELPAEANLTAGVLRRKLEGHLRRPALLGRCLADHCDSPPACGVEGQPTRETLPAPV